MVFTRSGQKAEQHVAIAGAGRVGYRTARVLHDDGHELYLIERDPGTVDAVTGRRTGVVTEGDATDPNVRRRTDVLTALTGNDTTNVVIRGKMQHLTDQIRSIARVCGPERPGTATESVEEFIHPERVGSNAVVNTVQEDDTRTLEDIAGDLDVLDIRVDPRSPVAGKHPKETPSPDGSQVVSDADGTETARPETTLRPGRRYPVAAEPSVADDVHKLPVG